MTLAGIRALSFDLDDTLWDCAPAIRHAEATLHAWFARETPRVLEHHDRESLIAFRADIAAEHPHLRGDVTAMRRTGIARLLAEHDYPEPLLDEAFAVFHRARSEVVLYDGVPEALAALGRRYRMAAITNGNADLEQIGLAGHFAFTLAASLELAPKPAPEMFELCLERFGIAAHELLHIGDNVSTDVGGAQRAGVRALWFNGRDEGWPEALPPPDFEVRSIAGLAELLGAPIGATAHQSPRNPTS